MKRSVRLFISFLLILCLAAMPLAVSAAALGDVDGEGGVTTEDARYALRVALDLEKCKKGSEKFKAADIIADGKITTEDARLILRIALDLEPTESQYDILRSGNFIMEGTFDDTETSPVKMAISDKLIYMETTADDITLGYLAKGSSIYLLSPAGMKYHKLNTIEKSALKSSGLMTEAELREVIDGFGFDAMPPLEDADSVSGGELNGVPCTVYTFNMEDGSKTSVYMYGYRLLAFGAVSAEGEESSLMTFNEISGDVPDLPTSDYKSVSLMNLMVDMAGEME